MWFTYPLGLLGEFCLQVGEEHAVQQGAGVGSTDARSQEEQ